MDHYCCFIYQLQLFVTSLLCFGLTVLIRATPVAFMFCFLYIFSICFLLLYCPYCPLPFFLTPFLYGMCCQCLSFKALFCPFIYFYFISLLFFGHFLSSARFFAHFLKFGNIYLYIFLFQRQFLPSYTPVLDQFFSSLIQFQTSFFPV